jgi:hypothetical protein
MGRTTMPKTVHNKTQPVQAEHEAGPTQAAAEVRSRAGKEPTVAPSARIQGEDARDLRPPNIDPKIGSGLGRRQTDAHPAKNGTNARITVHNDVSPAHGGQFRHTKVAIESQKEGERHDTLA